MKRTFINKVTLSPADRNCSGPRCINKAEVLSCGRPQGSGRQFNRAFTLVELLVVVLIIGILSAIAIPMYQGAVDKSHWSTMLPASKAIKDAEEAIKMTNGYYTPNMDDLDVRMNSTDLDFVLDIKDSLSEPNVIRVTNSKLGDKVRLASYLDDSPKFAGQLHCEAKNEGSTPNERGQRLCEKLLNGQYLKTTDDGYTRYLLDQAADKATCGAATGSWSTSKNKCYNSTAERCGDLGLPVLENTDYPDQCGTDNQGTIQAEEACVNCWNTTIEQGGVCVGYESWNDVCRNDTVQGAIVCNGSMTCGTFSTFDGGVCIANSTAGTHACALATFKNNSVCFANATDACGSAGSYKDTSCCCGDYCSGKPTCSADRCAEARAQYAQYFK